MKEECDICVITQDDPANGSMWAVYVDGDHPDGPGFIRCEEGDIPADAAWICQECFNA